MPGIICNDNTAILHIDIVFQQIIPESIHHPSDCVYVHPVTSRSNNTAHSASPEFQFFIKCVLKRLLVRLKAIELLFQVWIKVLKSTPMLIGCLPTAHLPIPQQYMYTCPNSSTFLFNILSSEMK